MDTSFLIAVAVGILSAPIAAACVVAWRSFTPPQVSGTVPELPAGISRAEIEFPGPAGTLRGWRVLPSRPPRGQVLLVHGWGSHAASMLRWSGFLAEAGWASVAFDVRNHGRSDGDDYVSLPRFAEDLTAALAFLDRDPVVASLPRAVLGHSMGGAAVLLVLSRGARADAAIISSAFARVETLTDFILRKWFIPPALFRWVVKVVWSLRLGQGLGRSEPENTIRGLDLPLLLTHGTKDPLIPDREMERLQRAAPPQCTEVLTVAGAGHSDLTGFEAYREGVLAFLERRLDRSLPSP